MWESKIALSKNFNINGIVVDNMELDEFDFNLKRLNEYLKG